MTAPADTTRLGHFLGPHGVQGGVKVYVLGDPQQLLALERVWVEGRGWLRVRRAEALAPGVALQLAGITSREGAEELRGANVYAADADLPPLEAGRYYYHELRGLPVQGAGGEQVGEVRDVVDAGHQDLLVVTHAGGEGFLPLQAPYVVVRTGETGRPAAIALTEDAPAGLLGEGVEE
ncbi:16S rRNA processing protein RimM [Deinococcus metallilatus]|uniref:Ribosome maturation factor RimM n=1 Tax=Deinococcus metallilatus TaxID=1211322 RepID=A0AAJ5F6R0_9DEIO|nr:ribosome maturation factor RimM [Deinococcus metallilatus]MBB5296691.1 16S rRNA processing protein RimM [Deinococcus metallilatus]QBY09225.1 16S rRNA processing protein RimM [Deinococcus metallilatus]RXJ09744.1 16S rRNA processing protein RimM [Deinococcus metallilatus]TLK24210.1 16S rRNA processing protein RimM [Deinococcus metallilatus]GMA13723.1 ribosome maturation factor RimM [Deinococcus metallilatus]